MQIEKLQYALSKCLWLLAEAYQYVGGDGEGRDKIKMLDALYAAQNFEDLIPEKISDEVTDMDPLDLEIYK